MIIIENIDEGGCGITLVKCTECGWSEDIDAFQEIGINEIGCFWCEREAREKREGEENSSPVI